MDRPPYELKTSPGQTAAADGLSEEGAWHGLTKVLFRFGLLYFSWYTLSFFKLYLNEFGESEDPISRAWDQVLVWVGKNVLHLGYTIRVGPNSSGDTTADYLHLLVMVVFCTVGSLVWTALDHRRAHYRQLGGWLHVACRYYLMAVLMSYGFLKVFEVQFPSPPLTRLVQPFGDSSPLGLVGTFMGYSRAYTFFAGLGEVVAGLLLLSRKTTTLGVLVTVGVLSNVVMMNFAYDIPAKLFSSHLLLLAVVLLLLDGRRLLDVFVLGRAVPAVGPAPHFVSRRARAAGRLVKALLVGGVLYDGISGGLEHERSYGPGAPKPPLYGLYEVETFVLDGEERPPLLNDTERWRNLVIDFPGSVTLRRMDGTTSRHAFQVDEGARTATFFASSQDRETKFSWSYRQPTPETLILEGELPDGAFSAEMRKRDPGEFLLVGRGFHWINEFPFYR